MSGSESVLECRRLVRSYGDIAAVAGVTASIGPQEVVILVGPNGCGKTTLVEILLGLRRRDAGEVRMMGVDPRIDRAKVARHLGVTLQGAALHSQVTVAEHIEFIGALFGVPARRVDEVVERLGIQELLKRRFGRLSGGQQRRVMVAASLVGHPRLAVLDEPTSGVDMESRAQVWSGLRTAMVTDGTAVLATTHDLSEAEAHADRVLVMRGGRLLAVDSPRRLIEDCGLALVMTVRATSVSVGTVGALGEGELELERVPGSWTVGFRSADRATECSERWSAELGEQNVTVRRPTLADAYLVLAGSGAGQRAGELA